MGDIQIQQLQAELERIRNSEGGSSFNDLVQRMMFKCGVTRIGPLTNEELVNEIDASFAASSAGGIMDRKTFHEVINSKKMMELRLRKLIAEIQADYWMESKHHMASMTKKFPDVILHRNTLPKKHY